MSGTGASRRVKEVAKEIQDGDTNVGFTGAGVSTASGIPDFRGEDGLWERYDPSAFRVGRFRSDPESFWETMLDVRRESFSTDPVPNPAHDALTRMYDDGKMEAVVTQNVDGLHQASGVPDDAVVELHGNVERVACEACGRRDDADEALERVDDLPPVCVSCGEPVKPDTVLFGERLPEGALYRARELARNADVVLVAGSSLTVEPAASIPRLAEGGGTTLVVVNFDPTPSSVSPDYEFNADVTDILPAIADEVSG
ncbi:MAG: Sir2 family NAD-dependent protein deacetylase [Halobacteriales archaeon]|nr:Sir2 family NAD-dependent protein deacetylase [Halobacteriales archaeon]